MPSTAASFPDEVEVEVEVSPTEFDSRTPVSSSFLSLSFSLFLIFRLRLTPSLEVAVTKFDSAPGTFSSSSSPFFLSFISSFQAQDRLAFSRGQCFHSGFI